MSETLDYYNAHAKALCSQYDKAIPEAFHRLLARWITPNTSVLELGCGSGRDARFMAGLGARVTATDGSAGMLSEARERKGKPIYRLLSLPASASDVARLRTDNSDKAFDVVVASAVLMHLNDEAFFRTARNIAELTKEDGLLILSVPLGHPADDTRFYAARPVEAIRFTLEDFGFQVLTAEKTNDAAKRAIAWVTLVLRKSRQISRRRQKLQSVLFEDRKTSTYKLALLRALCEMASSDEDCARVCQEHTVAVPLSRVVEKWIGYYWTLLGTQQIGGTRKTGFETALKVLTQCFAGDYFAFRRALESESLSNGASSALKFVRSKMALAVKKGPITYSGMASGEPVFTHLSAQSSPPRFADDSGFGFICLDADLWSEMRQTGLLFIDSILLQWADLTARFSRGETDLADVLPKLLACNGCERDTGQARLLYAQKENLTCVWSGKTLLKNRFDVDHILPWSFTHNNALWNLMPASPSVNRAKSDKLPDFEFFYSRKDKITDNWRYLADTAPNLFRHQVADSLVPGGLTGSLWWEPLFDATGKRLETIAQRFGTARWTL